MVPARNLLHQHYGGHFSNSRFDFEKPLPALSMASREEDEEEEEEEEAGTSSREHRDQCWLRLGVGVGVPAVAPRPELELFAPRLTAPMPPPPPQPHLGMFRRPAFYSPVRRIVLPSETPAGQLRISNPPARGAPPGVWFLLKALQNQVKEPHLPQIPKSYIRIKDGRMTVRLLKKYLVSKLGLEDESEVEISCRGQPLLPFLTLQHVRDNIWQLRETSTSLALMTESLPYGEHHLMTLQYGRSCP